MLPPPQHQPFFILLVPLLLLMGALSSGAQGADPLPAPTPLTQSDQGWIQALVQERKSLATPANSPANSPQPKNLAVAEFAKKLWRDFPLQCDWFLQDNQVHGKWGDDLGTDSRGDLAAYLNPDRDNSLETQLLTPVAKEVGIPMSAAFPAGDPKWLEEYLKLCHLRRAMRLQPLAAVAPRIIYAVHHNMGVIYLATETQGCPGGSELRMLDLSPLAKGEPIKDESLFDAKGGIVRDPEISFDGKRLLFAWRKTSKGANTIGQCAPETGNYKINEMDLATREVRPLTTDETVLPAGWEHPVQLEPLCAGSDLRLGRLQQPLPHEQGRPLCPSHRV